jgi:hypothetical protein
MLQGTIPPGTSKEVWSSVKEVIETSIKEWNDSNGKVDLGVRFCAGKDISNFSSSCWH